MPNVHLHPCPQCTRHVRVSETSCPFCAAALADEFRSTPAPRPPTGRLTRAALLALGTTAAVAASACVASSHPETEIPPMMDAAYGEPPGWDAEPPQHDAGTDGDAAMMSADAYGTVPFHDSGSDAMKAPGDASLDGDRIANDAGSDADMMTEDAYGIPSFDGDVMYDAAYGEPPDA